MNDIKESLSDFSKRLGSSAVHEKVASAEVECQLGKRHEVNYMLYDKSHLRF